MESGTQAVQSYFNTVRDIYARGNATEHSYRPALQALLQATSDKITATNEPKRIACGAPDFAITRAATSGARTAEHYQRTLAALAETAALMGKVDEVIEEAGGWPLG